MAVCFLEKKTFTLVFHADRIRKTSNYLHSKCEIPSSQIVLTNPKNRGERA